MQEKYGNILKKVYQPGGLHCQPIGASSQDHDSSNQFSQTRGNSCARRLVLAIIRRVNRRASMKLLFLVSSLFAIALLAAQPSLAQNAFTPDQVKFGPAPPFLPAGAQLAVLEGDPLGPSGDYTGRLKMPNSYKIAPPNPPPR